MPINLSVPRNGGIPLIVPIENGQCVFVLGANGTGKSSLMHRLYNANPGAVRRISAHRQTWFASSSLDLSPEQKRQTETNIQRLDTLVDARWKVDLPRFGGRVVESIYSGVLMLLLRLALGFSVPGFLSLGTSNAVCRVSGRSFAVC
jgi:hypothetical protein